jgi:hypothetical protein
VQEGEAEAVRDMGTPVLHVPHAGDIPGEEVGVVLKHVLDVVAHDDEVLKAPGVVGRGGGGEGGAVEGVAEDEDAPARVLLSCTTDRAQLNLPELGLVGRAQEEDV